MKSYKDDKRKLIIDTAFKLFMEKGYLNTKIIDIAEAAGIGKGTFYAYFPSKESLFTYLLNKHVFDKYKALEKNLKTWNKNNREKLCEYIFFEQELAKKFGNGKNHIDRLAFAMEEECQSNLKKLLNKLTKCRFNIVYTIITDGMECEEFKKSDPIMVSLSLIGSLSVFLSCNYGLLCEPIEHKFKSWDLDEFINLIFNGLLKSNCV